MAIIAVGAHRRFIATLLTKGKLFYSRLSYPSLHAVKFAGGAQIAWVVQRVEHEIGNTMVACSSPALALVYMGDPSTQ